jgi:hypothetical protein
LVCTFNEVSWPYDGTEDVYVDFYQVVRSIGDKVAVRRMALEPVSGRVDDGVVVPIPDRFIHSTRITENEAGEIIRRVLHRDMLGTCLGMTRQNYRDLSNPVDGSYALLWDWAEALPAAGS